MENTETFLKSEYERVRKNYMLKHTSGFTDRDNFAQWFINKLVEQEYKCHYCNTSIFDIKQLITSGKLRTRKVKGKRERGPVLEIDKNVNSIGYQPSNCVLACYYCNNDKSYILDGDDYKAFFGDARKKYFEYLQAQPPNI